MLNINLHLFAVCLLPLITFSSPRNNVQVAASLTTSISPVNQSELLARNVFTNNSNHLEKRQDEWENVRLQLVGEIGDSCTGTNINNRGYVLTAADCVSDNGYRILGVEFTVIRRGRRVLKPITSGSILTPRIWRTTDDDRVKRYNNIAVFHVQNHQSHYWMKLNYNRNRRLEIGTEVQILSFRGGGTLETTAVITNLNPGLSFQISTVLANVGAPVYISGEVYGVISGFVASAPDGRSIFDVAEITEQKYGELRREIRRH